MGNVIIWRCWGALSLLLMAAAVAFGWWWMETARPGPPALVAFLSDYGVFFLMNALGASHFAGVVLVLLAPHRSVALRLLWTFCALVVVFVPLAYWLAVVERRQGLARRARAQAATQARTPTVQR